MHIIQTVGNEAYNLDFPADDKLDDLCRKKCPLQIPEPLYKNKLISETCCVLHASSANFNGCNFAPTTCQYSSLSVLLLMAILTQPLLTLVRGNLMSFTFFTARHSITF